MIDKDSKKPLKPEADTHESSSPKYWTTLEEHRGDPRVAELKQSEFFSKPEDFFDQENTTKHSLTGKPGVVSEAAGFVSLAVKNNGGAEESLSRRDFLKISGAAAVFATAGCALRPTEKIIPYVKAPEEIVPGVANYYASTSGGRSGAGVLIKTREGRPIKLEGNPDHPLSGGKLGARDQLDIFNLYDPDRLTAPIRLDRARQKPSAITWNVADREIAEALKSAEGRVAVLTGTIHGPARKRVIEDFLSAFPGSRHVMYDAWNSEATRSAQAACYGEAVLPRYHFDKAEYVLCLEADPFGSGYAATEWQVGFGKQRKVRNGKMAKLVAADSHLTLTSANADVRYRIKPGDGALIGLAVAVKLVATGRGTENSDGLADTVRLFGRIAGDAEFGLPDGTIAHIADELWAHRGEGLVLAGESAEAQIAANLLNTLCGNEGQTVDSGVPSNQSHGSLLEMLSLIEDMKSGKVNVLITWGTNPAYSLPPSAGFADALSRVKTVVSLGDRADETGILGNYILPTVHWLENWGDAEPQVGLFSLTQPTIYPLHDCRASEQSLMSFAKAAETEGLGLFEGEWEDFLKETWQRDVYGAGDYVASFDRFWTGALRDGVVDTRVKTEVKARSFNPEALRSVKAAPSNSSGLKLVVCASTMLGEDGNGNNAWVLETPDPISKITWTNYASISPKTATDLLLKEGDVVALKANGQTSELPVHIQPGDSDNTITVQSGWGRTHVGRVGENLGVNAFEFCGIQGTDLQVSGIGCTLDATGRTEEMPCVQGHDYIEGRPIIQEATFENYLKDPGAGALHKHDLVSMWTDHDYPGNRWGMTIDLSACLGCHACTSACQVENNIPVVGREEIQIGREMHWIRVDRYYSGEEEDPELVFQPMPCQHCENAPCETVCPVLATVHSNGGLNLQVYNRCVGTRYCANNCPYKVRRFNFYEYSFAAYDPTPLQLVLNPDVTVREKGVMEKCSFCQHRIREGKERAKEMGRSVMDEDIVTACQQACPTDAIRFGNFNNAESAVAEDRKDERAYTVLQELNAKPSVTYRTKLRNRDGRPWDAAGHGGGHSTEGHHS